jgi:hypothetical protein
MSVAWAVVFEVRRWSLAGGWQEGLVDVKSLTEGFTRLAGAGVDYAYGRRSPFEGVTMELLLLCDLQVGGLAELHLFLVVVCVDSAPAPRLF